MVYFIVQNTRIIYSVLWAPLAFYDLFWLWLVNLTHVFQGCFTHYSDFIIGAVASQITSLTIIYSTVYLDADQRKHQSSASLAFVRGIHRGPVNSPNKWPITRKMRPFDDVIMLHLDAMILVKRAIYSITYMLLGMFCIHNTGSWRIHIIILAGVASLELVSNPEQCG